MRSTSTSRTGARMRASCTCSTSRPRRRSGSGSGRTSKLPERRRRQSASVPRGRPVDASSHLVVLAGVTVPSATLALKSVTRRFGPVTAVDRIDLEIEQDEFFALLGPSGSGKTTLLRIIAGLERPDEGQRGDRRPRRHRPAALWAPRRHGVPEFPAVPAQDGGGEHRLSAAHAEPAQGAARRAAGLGHGPAAAARGWRRAIPTSSPAGSSSGWRWRAA